MSVRLEILAYARIFELASHFFSEYIAEPAAEFTGVMLIVIFGNGGGCQATLSTNAGVSNVPKGVRCSTSIFSSSL